MSAMAAPVAVFTSNVNAFIKDHQKAIDDALVTMGETYKNAVSARLALGYKSGTFKTGKVAGSVKVSEPKTEKGRRTVRVYTSNFIARLWEFGHMNRYSRKWERVPVWRPIAMQQGHHLAAQMLTSYGAMMAHWKPRRGKGAARSHKRSKS